MGPGDAVVAEPWRSPVTSMRAERFPVVEVQADGVVGDGAGRVGANYQPSP